jgi:hypothetical protein
MPFPTHRPYLFCLISPEAVLLTVCGIINIYTSNETRTKAGKGLTEKRAKEFCLRAEAFFCLDLLVTFLPREK